MNKRWIVLVTGILVVAVAAALVRRLGVINFLEAIMVLVLWLSMDLSLIHI